MTRTCRSGLAALGAFALAGVLAGDAVAAPAAQVRPVAQAPAAAAKLKNRDRGSFNVPHPQSAYFALGLARRFYKQGDTWVMAWSAMTRPEIQKVSAGQAKVVAPFGKPQFVRYQVIRVWQHRLGPKVRTLAKIRMSWGKAPAKSYSTHADLTIDQFFNPVAFRLYDEDMPYGQRQDKDTRRVIHGVGEFPLYVGDLENAPARLVPMPRLNPALTGQRMIPTGNTYAVTVANGRDVHGMTYWAPGNLYASYVTSMHHVGILISQQMAR